MLNVESNPDIGVIRFSQDGAELLVQPTQAGNRVVFNRNGGSLLLDFRENEATRVDGPRRHPLQVCGFSQIPLDRRPGLSVGIRLSGSSDIPNNLRLLHTLRIMTEGAFHFMSSIPRLNDIPDEFMSLVRALASESTIANRHNFVIRSEFDGGKESLEKVLEILDAGLCSLEWISNELKELKSSVQNQIGWENYLAFEDAGYILPISVKISLASILNPESSRILASGITQVLTDNPNRRIGLVLPWIGEPLPGRSDWNPYRFFTDFMVELLDRDCDVSKIRNIGMYLDNTLGCATDRIEIEVALLDEERLAFFLPVSDTPFVISALDAKEIRETFSSILNLAFNPSQNLECSQCPLASLCPKLTTYPYFAFSDLDPNNLLVAQKELCRTHKIAFSRVLSDLFGHFEDATNYLKPLRLAFGQNKEIAVSSLD